MSPLLVQHPSVVSQALVLSLGDFRNFAKLLGVDWYRCSAGVIEVHHFWNSILYWDIRIRKDRQLIVSSRHETRSLGSRSNGRLTNMGQSRDTSGTFRGAGHRISYITWSITETSKFTIALRAIFQSLRYLPLVENAYHNFNLPPCATPGLLRARHEGGQ